MKNKFRKKYKFIKKYKIFIWPNFIFKRKKSNLYRFIYPKRLYKFFYRTILSLRLDYLPIRQKFKKSKKSFKHIQHDLVEIVNAYYCNIRPIQFKKYFYRVRKRSRYLKHPSIGFNFLTTLETRLDSLLIKLSLSETMFQAKQLLKRGCFKVNNKICLNFNYELKAWDDVLLINYKYKNYFYMKLWLKFKFSNYGFSKIFKTMKKNYYAFFFFNNESKTKIIYNNSNYMISNYTFMHFWMYKYPNKNDLKLPFQVYYTFFYGIFHKNNHY